MATEESTSTRSCRKWSEDDLASAIHDIQNGETYQDVSHASQIPMGTLWSRIKGKYQGTVKPKMGAPRMFSEELEADIALFVKHMQLLRVPVSKEKLKADIAHFLSAHRMKITKMGKEGPGRGWFERFATIWSELVDFKTKGEIFRICNDPITMRTWVFERDKYTRIQKFTKSFCNRSYIFVAEVQKLSLVGNNKLECFVVLIYNADGDLLKPILVHGGDISGYCEVNYSDIFEFVRTEKGDIDREVVSTVWSLVRRFLQQRELKDIPVVYYAPRLAKFISFYLWDQCNLENVIVQTIPFNIYNYFRTGNMGVFEKVTPSFQRAVKNHFRDGVQLVTSIHFCDVLKESLVQLRIASHLRNSCRRLRIVAVHRLEHVDEIVYDVQEEPDVEADGDNNAADMEERHSETNTETQATIND